MTGIAPTPSSPEQGKAQRLAEVLALIGTRTAASERTMFTTFCQGYFRLADPEDVCERSAEDLYGMVHSHLQFARQDAHRPVVRDDVVHGQHQDLLLRS